MATGIRQDPFVGYRFRVEIDGIQTAAFTEASIPNSETKTQEYREGTDPKHVRKVSGMISFGNLTLKKGLTGNGELREWRNQVEEKGAAGNRRSISLILIDEEGKDSARWEISEAWPTKLDTTGFKASSADVMVETLELVHEGVKKVS